MFNCKKILLYLLLISVTPFICIGALDSHGKGIIKHLGDQLPQVAKKYKMTSEEFIERLNEQDSIHIDNGKNLYFVCDGLAVSQTPTTQPQLVQTSSIAPDVYKLHSLPGASKVIYLDFNGHTTTGTNWNTFYTGGAPIVSDPYVVSDAFIEEVWKNVAEDYAPFAIDVTTEDPGVEALRKTNANDNNYGVRVVISPTFWYRNPAGGVAYIGSFNWNTDTPCWVFTVYCNQTPHHISIVASHEIGHTLGLYHQGFNDGTTFDEYYRGWGDWGPIMGAAWNQFYNQWSKGEYLYANNFQDEIAVIKTYGTALVSDDHGNTKTTATVLNGSIIEVGGLIDSQTDVDVFSFTCGSGQLDLTVSFPAPEPNLIAGVQLLDSNYNVILTPTPERYTTKISTNVVEGVYYLKLDGVAINNFPSDYGSIGDYIITGTVPPPVLKISNVQNGIKLSWPANSSSFGWGLQETTNLGSSWNNSTRSITVVGNENQVIISPFNTNTFFRLSCPTVDVSTKSAQPVGGVLITIPAGISQRSVGIPLAGPSVFRNTVTNNTPTIITVGGNVNFSNVLTSGKQYYIETTDTGDRLEIDTAATITAANNNLTISTNNPIRNTITLSTDNLIARPFTIREHKTLASIFGNKDNPLGMYGTTSINTSDQILLLNGQIFETYYYLKGGTYEEWRMVGGGNSDNVVIPPGVGMIVKRQSSSAPQTVLTQLGEVRTNVFHQPLVAGYNMVSEPYPKDHSPNVKAMTVTNGFYGTTSISTADYFLVYNVNVFDSYYLLKYDTIEEWRKIGVYGINYNDVALFTTDSSTIIFKRSDDSNYTVPLTFPW